MKQFNFCKIINSCVFWHYLKRIICVYSGMM